MIKRVLSNESAHNDQQARATLENAASNAAAYVTHVVVPGACDLR